MWSVTTWRGDEMKPAKVAAILPPDVRDELVAASRIRDPLLRQISVQQAAERAQKRCPKQYQVFNQPPKGTPK